MNVTTGSLRFAILMEQYILVIYTLYTRVKGENAVKNYLKRSECVGTYMHVCISTSSSMVAFSARTAV